MADFSRAIKRQLDLVGRPTTVKKANGGEDFFFAVIEPTWKRNKTKFENTASKAGMYYNEYYQIICPYNVNLKAYGKNDIIVVENERYELGRSERVSAFGKTQYYRGIVKKIWEVDTDVFK